MKNQVFAIIYLNNPIDCKLVSNCAIPCAANPTPAAKLPAILRISKN